MCSRSRLSSAPGVSLAVLDKGALASVRGLGVARAGGPEAVMADTMFQAGSVSKTVAALLVLHLASGSRLGLGDPAPFA